MRLLKWSASKNINSFFSFFPPYHFKNFHLPSSPLSLLSLISSPLSFSFSSSLTLFLFPSLFLSFARGQRGGAEQRAVGGVEQWAAGGGGSASSARRPTTTTAAAGATDPMPPPTDPAPATMMGGGGDGSAAGDGVRRGCGAPVAG